MENLEFVKNKMDVFDQVEIKYSCVENDIINKQKYWENYFKHLGRKKFSFYSIQRNLYWMDEKTANYQVGKWSNGTYRQITEKQI